MLREPSDEPIQETNVRSARRAASIFVAGFAAALGAAEARADVNLYTTREPGLIKPLLEAFEKETGVKVNTVFLKDGLAERLLAEGENSPADVLMTVDFGNLVDLKEKGVTQPISSGILDESIPAQLRDRDGHWYALSLRARVLYADKELGLKSFAYEDLADPKWKGKICIRSGQHPYNTAMIADYIAHHGAEKAEAWLTAVKANLARKPAGGDRDVAKDILGGVCDIGIGNSYYVGLMRSGKSGPEQVEWSKAIEVVLPTFEDGGTHVNVSGAAVAKHAPNKDEAVKLLEYLVSDEEQAIYAKGNYEYPVKPGAQPDPLIAELGALKPDTTPLAVIAQHRKEASRLVDKVGFDQ
jgi:iron(III) transport system substrate-binding protein